MFNATTCLYFVQQVFDEPLLLVLSVYCFYCTQIIMPPPLIGGGIKQCFCPTSLCLSVAYIGPKSRTEKPRKTKNGTEVAHVARDSDSTFEVKKVKVTRPLYSPRP